MPLTLRVGCSRKIGQPGYSSLGASCALDVELDVGLVERDPEALRGQIRSAFAACRAAVAEELARQETMVSEPEPGPALADRSMPPPAQDPSSGTGTGPGRSASRNGPDGPARGGRPASEKQCQAIRAIARRHGADLGTILRQEFRVDRVEELSVSQASRLIDSLKADAAV
jgi:hypothetical protein